MQLIIILLLLLVIFVQKNCFRRFELIKTVPNSYDDDCVCESQTEQTPTKNRTQIES